MKVLHSSDENGLCYIDTQNLDGEANLKQREVPRGLFAKGEDSSQFSPAEFREALLIYTSPVAMLALDFGCVHGTSCFCCIIPAAMHCVAQIADSQSR